MRDYWDLLGIRNVDWLKPYICNPVKITENERIAR